MKQARRGYGTVAPGRYMSRTRSRSGPCGITVWPGSRRSRVPSRSTSTLRGGQQVRKVRSALQAVVRGDQPPDVLSPALRGVTSVPAVTGGQLTWTLHVPPDRQLAVRAVLAWDALARHSPGRLRPCANDECRLFLIDRSKANAARWCSMALCGNRMKARRHYQRGRTAPPE
jgi:predicted RNA-binding Zn ribbon-like protein